MGSMCNQLAASINEPVILLFFSCGELLSVMFTMQYRREGVENKAMKCNRGFCVGHDIFSTFSLIGIIITIT